MKNYWNLVIALVALAGIVFYAYKHIDWNPPKKQMITSVQVNGKTMLTNPVWWILVGILLVLLILMRLMLRVSTQWRVLKTNWTWKDELMDTAFYFILLLGTAAVVFKLFEYISR